MQPLKHQDYLACQVLKPALDFSVSVADRTVVTDGMYKAASKGICDSPVLSVYGTVFL